MSKGPTETMPGPDTSESLETFWQEHKGAKILKKICELKYYRQTGCGSYLDSFVHDLSDDVILSSVQLIW